MLWTAGMLVACWSTWNSSPYQLKWVASSIQWLNVFYWWGKWTSLANVTCGCILFSSLFPLNNTQYNMNMKFGLIIILQLWISFLLLLLFQIQSYNLLVKPTAGFSLTSQASQSGINCHQLNSNDMWVVVNVSVLWAY